MPSLQERIEEAKKRAISNGDTYEISRCRAAEKELQQGNVERAEAVVEELEVAVLDTESPTGLLDEEGSEEMERRPIGIYGGIY